MNLYILRHGDAVAHGDPRYSEAERPLTPKGVQRTRLLALAFRRMEISFDAVLSSPLARARQTAEIVTRGLRLEGWPVLTENLAPGGRFEHLVKEINHLDPAPQSVLLVGHEPYLSEFISLLLVGGPHLMVTFKKGGLCRMKVDELCSSKCATLEWLLPPSLLAMKRPKAREKRQTRR